MEGKTEWPRDVADGGGGGETDQQNELVSLNRSDLGQWTGMTRDHGVCNQLVERTTRMVVGLLLVLGHQPWMNRWMALQL